MNLKQILPHAKTRDSVFWFSLTQSAFTARGVYEAVLKVKELSDAERKAIRKARADLLAIESVSQMQFDIELEREQLACELADTAKLNRLRNGGRTLLSVFEGGKQ